MCGLSFFTLIGLVLVLFFSPAEGSYFDFPIDQIYVGGDSYRVGSIDFSAKLQEVKGTATEGKFYFGIYAGDSFHAQLKINNNILYDFGW